MIYLTAEQQALYRMHIEWEVTPKINLVRLSCLSIHQLHEELPLGKADCMSFFSLYSCNLDPEPSSLPPPARKFFKG